MVPRNTFARPQWLSRFACGTLAVSLAGCGGNASPTAAPSAAAAPVPAAAPASAVAPVAATVASPRSTATKWIGGIPYDVFYDRPLEVAADQTLLATAAATPAAPTLPNAAPAVANPAAPTTTPAAAPAAMPAAAPAASTAAAPGTIDWAAVAPMELLVEEVVNLRNSLQAKLNTLADYNKSWETIGVDATALAAIAGVVEQHPGDVSWKANARLVRHLASEINANASKTGRSAYDATKAPFDSLVDLLGGNPPAGIEAEPQLPFGDYADRSVLMATLEQTLNYAKSNITTDERLAENPAETKRKMTVLATLMSVVATPSYDATAEADYQKFAQTFIKSAMSGRDAVDAKDLATFTAAVNEMQKTCTECHAKYAFGGENF